MEKVWLEIDKKTIKSFLSYILKEKVLDEVARFDAELVEQEFGQAKLKITFCLKPGAKSNLYQIIVGIGENSLFNEVEIVGLNYEMPDVLRVDEKQLHKEYLIFVMQACNYHINEEYCQAGFNYIENYFNEMITPIQKIGAMMDSKKDDVIKDMKEQFSYYRSLELSDAGFVNGLRKR